MMNRLILVIVAVIYRAAPATASWPSSLLSSQPAFLNHYHHSSINSVLSIRRVSALPMHPPTDRNVQRLVLIGGGHAHVQVIKALNATSRSPNLHVTLIDLQSSASYSGMVPGCVAKLYTLDQVQIALDALANWAGIEFVCGKVVGMSFEGNDGQKLVLVEVTDGNGGTIHQEYPFDVVSVDIGSTTRDFTTISGAQQYTISTRPISDMVRRIEEEEEILKEKIRQVWKFVFCISCSQLQVCAQRYFRFTQYILSTGAMNDGVKVVVVGGGAAGVELCFALRARWDALLDSKLSITLLDSNSMLLPSETYACRSALKYVMKKYDIEVRHNLVVDEVTRTHICVKSNSNKSRGQTESIPYTHCIWATGAEAHKLSWDLHKQCGLDVSDKGWIRVNQKLQSMSHPSVFAAGDCCEMVTNIGRSPPKAGVYAVRSGPILIENLTRYLNMKYHSEAKEGGIPDDLVTYHPQDDFLKLLTCGDGTALGFRFGIPCEYNACLNFQTCHTITIDAAGCMMTYMEPLH
jgi:NADH dehydrogenase FAD-containing subunit